LNVHFSFFPCLFYFHLYLSVLLYYFFTLFLISFIPPLSYPLFSFLSSVISFPSFLTITSCPAILIPILFSHFSSFFLVSFLPYLSLLLFCFILLFLISFPFSHIIPSFLPIPFICDVLPSFPFLSFPAILIPLLFSHSSSVLSLFDFFPSLPFFTSFNIFLISFLFCLTFPSFLLLFFLQFPFLSFPSFCPAFLSSFAFLLSLFHFPSSIFLPFFSSFFSLFSLPYFLSFFPYLSFLPVQFIL
jgi:hypothetical protein